MGNEEILEKLRQADMVLAGLGEDFDESPLLRQDERYLSCCGELKKAGLRWLMPAWNEFCMERSGSRAVDAALEKLGDILRGKNHFVVSVSMGSRVPGVGRTVMPCGSSRMKQCAGGCRETLMPVTEQDREGLDSFFQELYAEGRIHGGERIFEGVCPVCGQALVLNNVYAENYNEEGYLEQWRLYMKWLQGTLNRRLFVLELGVGMQFPSVIRWPFEKAAFFNKKAYFCRIHDRLYQLTKELSEKGCGISKNAIDWLGEL